MARVHLVRHGDHGLLGRVLAGRMSGVPLSEEGRAQADRLGRFFAAEPGVDRVLSSPMERCRETAAPIAARLGLPVEVREELNEIDCGAWTGRPFEALALDPRWQAWNRDRANNGIPGGETVGDVLQRVTPLLEHAGEADGATGLWVTHGDVIKVVAMALLGMSPDRHDRLEIGPASITTLDLWPGGGKLVRANAEVVS